MINDAKKWHYLAVKSLHALFRGIITYYMEDFCCLNCFYSVRTKNKLTKHKNVCKNGEKSMKVPLIIYADLESLLKKISTCHNNLVIHFLCIVYLIQQRISLIIIEVKIV